MDIPRLYKVSALPTSPTAADDGVYFVRPNPSVGYICYIITNGVAVQQDAVTTAALTTLLSDYVKKAGDTMTGTLTLASNIALNLGSTSTWGIKYDTIYSGINFARWGFTDGVLFIGDNERIGIGELNPEAKLHVNGNVIVDDATANNHAVTLGQVNGLNANKANTNGSNTIGGIWHIDAVFAPGLTTNNKQIFSEAGTNVYFGNPQLNILYFESLGNLNHYKGGVLGAIWTEHNFKPTQYVMVSSLNTTLAGYATLAGTQTFQNTITFNQSPIVPNGTLAGHTVNLGQLNTILSSYALASAIPTNNNQLTNGAGYITISALVGYVTQTSLTTQLNDKVDKVTGKQLSTEDYTSAEKTKLNNIAAGAEVNVNADWNATSGDAQILNKPTIPVIPNNLVTTNTTQTISATKDFTVSPTVPYASDSEHPVPFLQMQEYIANRLDAISSYSRNVINTNDSTIGVKEWIKTIVFATSATGTIINPEETLKNGAILNICTQVITAGSIDVNLPVRRLDGSNVSVYSFAQRKSYIFYYNDSYNRWDETHAINNS